MSSHMPLDPGDSGSSVVNVGEVLTASVAACLDADHARISISREFDDRLRVVCNRAQLEEVFVGLLRNAIESLAAAPATTHGIRLAAWRSAEQRIFVEISDTGGGISPEHVEHVFESSFTTKLEQAGSGSALHHCQQLIHAWGGTLYIRTTSTRGTSFRVELPGHTYVA
jgi:two-component system NtrC family sensor kinase